MLDPESSPPKPTYAYGSQNNESPSEDPWFSHNGRESPLNYNNPPGGQSFPFPGVHAQQGGYPSSSSSSYGHSGVMGGVGGGGGINGGFSLAGEEDFDNEPPLLEELGIRFDHIIAKTQAVIHPTKPVSEHILDDADLAGPLFFCLLLGACMLLSGKIHFGYIYGFSVFGCAALNAILNLLHPTGIDFWRTCSVLGYCLLPVIALAGIAIVISLKGFLGVIFSFVTIAWSTASATRLFDAKLQLTDQYFLVMYPVALLYSCFVLITVF